MYMQEEKAEQGLTPRKAKNMFSTTMESLTSLFEIVSEEVSRDPDSLEEMTDVILMEVAGGDLSELPHKAQVVLEKFCFWIQCSIDDKKQHSEQYSLEDAMEKLRDATVSMEILTAKLKAEERKTEKR